MKIFGKKIDPVQAVVDYTVGSLIGGPAGGAAGAAIGSGALAPSAPNAPVFDPTSASQAADQELQRLNRRRGAAATRLFGDTLGASSGPYTASATLLGQ